MYWYYFFSFWIYISFILYYFKLISFNPLPLFILTVIRDILFIFLNSSEEKKSIITSVLILRIFLVISIHYFPILYLYKSNKNNKKNNHFTLKSILFYILLFISYLVFIDYNNINLDYIFNDIDKNYVSLLDYINTRFDSLYIFAIWIIIVIYMNYKIITFKK